MNLCVCSYHSQCDVICVTLGGVEGVVLSQHVLNNRVFDLLWGSAAGKSNATSCLLAPNCGWWAICGADTALERPSGETEREEHNWGGIFFLCFRIFFNNIKISFLLVFGRLKVS